MTEYLSTNRTLQEVNIHFNSWLDAVRKRHEAQQLEEQSLFAKDMQSLIKYNYNLVHLNLSGLGITSHMADVIIESLRKTVSLICLHMSGNPCIQDLDMKKITRRIRAKKRIAPPDFVQPAKLLKASDQKEVLLLNKVQRTRAIYEPDFLVKDEVSNPSLIFTRKLGHKRDMPGVGQWEIIKEAEELPAHHHRKLNDQLYRPECWHCCNHTYTLVFWSRSIWTKTCTQSRQVQNEFAEYYARHLMKARTSSLVYSGLYQGEIDPFRTAVNGTTAAVQPSEEPASVYCQYTDWQEQKMHNLLELCEQYAGLSYSKPNFLEILQEEGRVPYDVETPTGHH